MPVNNPESRFLFFFITFHNG